MLEINIAAGEDAALVVAAKTDLASVIREAEEKRFRTDAARRATFETNELLEMILVELDTKTLLFSQRVCTAWKSIIGRSDLLQQALFFKLAKKDGRRFGIDGVNPLLMRHTHVRVDPRSLDYNKAAQRWAYYDFAPEDRELRIVHVEGLDFQVQLNFEALFGAGRIRRRYSRGGEDVTHHLTCSGSMKRMHPLQTPYTWHERGADGDCSGKTLEELCKFCCESTFFHRCLHRDSDTVFARLAEAASRKADKHADAGRRVKRESIGDTCRARWRAYCRERWRAAKGHVEEEDDDDLGDEDGDTNGEDDRQDDVGGDDG